MNPIVRRGGATLIAAACLLVGCALASRHRLEPVWLTVGAIAWSAVAWARPSIWLVVLPAFLPIADLSPSTGWVAIGEFDVLVLATDAGGYLRLAQEPGRGYGNACPAVSAGCWRPLWKRSRWRSGAVFRMPEVLAGISLGAARTR